MHIPPKVRLSDISHCSLPGIDDRIAGDIWQFVFASRGIKNFDADPMMLKIVRAQFAQDFAFIAFDSPHFAAIKEIAYYTGVSKQQVQRYYQRFLQWKRQQR